MNFALGSLCLALIGVVWAVTVERVRFERGETIASAVKQNANLAIALEEHTVRTLRGVDLALLLVKDRYDAYGLKLDIRRMTQGGTVDASLFTFIGVVDEHGKLVAGSSDFQPVYLGDREYFTFHRQRDTKQMFIGKPVLGRVTGKWSFHMTRRINKPDGSFGGVVYAAIDPEYFTEFYQKADLGEQGLVTLVGLDGITRARRVGQVGSYGQDMRNSALFAQAAKSPAGDIFDASDIDGVSRFYSYRTLPQYPLIVAVGMSQAETLAAFRQRARNYYIVAALASGVGLLAMAGLMTALSQRRRREDELQRFHAAMDASADAIYLVDRTSMRFVDVNQTACRMQGRSRAELLALGPDGVLAIPREELARAYDDVIAGGGAGAPVEMLRWRRDGTQVWVELRRSAQRSSTGWIMVTAVRDITARKNSEQAVRDGAEQLRQFADNVPAMTVSYDENLRCRFANKAFAEYFGFTPQTILGKHLREVVGEEAYREIEGHFAQVLQGHPVTYQRTRKLPSGKASYLEVKLLPHIGERGRTLGCFAVTTDITEHKRAEQALRDSAEQMRLFADNVPAMTVFWDESLRCRLANKVFTEFFDLGAGTILGKHLREVLGEDVYQEVKGYFSQALQGRPVTYQRTRRFPDGELRHIEVRLLPHIGDQGKILGCFAVTTDITAHKLAEERIQRVAHHDSLTGLPNRLLFNDRLGQAISLAKRDSRQFALLYLDLDRFKPVNDSLGHAVGDELLQAVAARIRHQVRESDTVARVGGDEFTVILPDITGSKEAETVSTKIVDAFAAPFQLASHKQEIRIGASIGIALYPADARDAEALVKAADAAMYRAKQAGSSFRFCGSAAG